MISEKKYIELVDNILNRNIMDNINQKNAVMAPLDENQYIVAGPGSGKTTVLVLKILKYYFVDDIHLNEIMVTTFTKKAARELKERIFSWAKEISNYLEIELDNFNDMLIGTLDSIAEELLIDLVDMDIIDNFTSSALMMQFLLADERNTDKKLKQFFKKLKNNHGRLNPSDMNNQIQSIRERIFYDMVDYHELEENANREKVLFNIINDYNDQLDKKRIMDYSLLEKKFFKVLHDEKIPRLDDIKILLIDEYQDTNYLQEQIYFEIAKYTYLNGGSITVVGDDDQSLYRFRGSTVELFTNFPERINNYLSITPKTIYLEKNYRSTKNIINFTNEFLQLDKKYLENRTINKPLISPVSTTEDGLPVMTMFRKNIKELSADLSNLIYNLKLGKDKIITRDGEDYNISLKKRNPSIAILANSPKEISAFNKKRLPYYIRECLSYKDVDLVVFNPRGQSIESTSIVSLICGLILITIDPNGRTQEKLENIPPHTENILKKWREYAEEYILDKNKEIISLTDSINLEELLKDIDKESSFLVKESNENSIYHDIIISTITQTNNAISFNGTLTPKQIFWHILVPIASGAIEIDDDMFDISLDDNINIMSFHQSKGLEFDIVIVDVGSDIYNNSSSNAFKRFPKSGGRTYNIENYLKNYSKLNKNYEKITGLDEAFNEIIRRYFVAYTRAKSILILVGLNSMRYGYKGDFQDNIKIPNVAIGWSRDEVWHTELLDNLLNI